MIPLVVGDTKPDLLFDLERDGEPINITVEFPDATFEFRLRKPDGNTVVVPLTVLDPLTGLLAGGFGAGDLNIAGPMRGEFVILDGDDVQHAPEPFQVYVRPEFQEGGN